MRSEVAQLLGAMLLCFAGARSDKNESELSNDHPTILVEKIRRQLMNENYDYMPSSESEELFPTRRELGNERTAPTTITPTTLHLDSATDELSVPRARDPRQRPADDANDDNSRAASNKHLLRYGDDEELDDTTTSTPVETTTPKVKYKVLKVKQSHPNRRSHSFRRFIQEEGGNGVAIINLDDEPFPEFRLPRARRQYMTEHGLDSDSDPDPDPDPDPEVAPRSDHEERT